MLSSKAKRELKIDQRQVLIESIEIGIASPQHIYIRGSRQLPNGKTVGLIKNSKTVNYKKFTPFRDGLFCERIFGPVTSLVCACGKKQPHSKITFCEKCEVEYIDQRSRRYRLGYISLLSPVTHIWYLKGRPSYLSLFLGKRKKTVVSLAYCNGYLIDHIPFKNENENQYKTSCNPVGVTFGDTLANRRSPKAATFGQGKPLSVSHLSKSDNLLQNNAYKSLPFIKKVLLLQETKGRDRITLACKSKICTPCTCKSKICMCMAIKSKKAKLAPKVSCFANQRFASPCKASLCIPEVIKSKICTPSGKANRCNDFVPLGCKSKICISPKADRSGFTRCIPKICTEDLQGQGQGEPKVTKHNCNPLGCKQICKSNKFSFNQRGCNCKGKTINCNPLGYKKICISSLMVMQSKALHNHQRSFALACGNSKAKTIAFTKGDARKLRIVTFWVKRRFVSGRKRIYLECNCNCKSKICKKMMAMPMPFGQGQGQRKKICNPKLLTSANRLQKEQIPLKLNRFLVNNRSAVNKNDFYRSTSYGKYFYTRQQCLPFLPSFVSHFYLRDALLNFMYSSPISEDIPILEYCNTKRIEPLQDVHKFMARQTLNKFKNADLSFQSINSSFTDFLPNVFRRRRSVAKPSFAQRGGEARAPFCKRVQVRATSPFAAAGHILSTRAYVDMLHCRAIIDQGSTLTRVKDMQDKAQANVSKTSLSAFRLKKLYQGKKHVYLDSFFKKIKKQNIVNSTSDLINKNIKEETNNTTLSNLELTAIREILSYTGGGAIQQLLKQYDPHDLGKFLVAERQILRALYQKHIAFTRDSLDLRPSSALDYLSNVSEYQANFSIIEKPFFSTAVREEIEIEDNGFALALAWPCTKCMASNCKSKMMAFGQRKKICTPTQEENSEARFVAKSDKNEPVSKRALNCFTLQEKGPFWGLENKKTQLYQKKEIMRISRRIYKVARRLKVAQLLTLNHRRPEWMILSHLPVLPPDLRPILQMSEKVIVASDLNIMYQRVIYRNNRHLRVRFIDFQLVTAIQRLVQDAVDRLMENGKGGSKPYYTQGGRPLKSLSDILKGKKGRFRLNLLGKRVDFSGRSVIVVAPSLKIHECGLPKDIALELYHYFLLRQLIVKKYCASIVTAKKMIKAKSAEMWDVLREVMYHHPVLLNRAPTLHRLGIQAFQPKLVVGSAIWLHPLVCSGFNADFDGDQMGVHLPLSFAARAESWDLLWSRNNLLSPATGQPMLVPSQDMVLGFYYMTAQGMTNRFNNQKRIKTTLTTHKKEVNKIIVFLNPKSIITNYQNGLLKLHTPVWLHWEFKIENENNSAKPFELRVSGFGAERYVFENYISNALFSGHAKANVSAWPCTCKSSICKCMASNCNPLGYKKICIPSASQIEALRANRIATVCPYQKGVGIVKSSFIFTEAKASYIRTTAGRVLMNNILKR